MTRSEFWQAVFLAVIAKQGCNGDTAAYAADDAINAWLARCKKWQHLPALTRPTQHT